MTRKEQLKADLLKNFSDFQKIKEPGGSAAANEIVAEGLADSIDRAIDDGVEFSFQGVFAVKDINAIQEKAPGYLYTCSDSGILKAKTELPVVKNTVVLWNGEDFKTFLVIPEATGSSVQISVDSFLSTFSGNPVQNKVVTTAINALSVTIASEAAARENADATLQGNIDAEATARENADATLQGNIDAEETAREDADATLQSNIESEATEREQADGELQAQIDAISSKSDVVDVVASYAELVAYDTSALGANDVVKVLEDETHDDAESYYRWNLTTQTWGYIGSQGPFVTPAEMQSALNGKVDKVSGKGLSTNDYTTAEKDKLAGIEAGADKSHVKFFLYNADYADIAAAMPYASPMYNVFLVGKEDGTYPRSYALVKFDRTNEEMVFAAMRNDSTLCTITKKSSLGTGWTYRDYPLAPQSHASSDTTYGTGDATHYGHVQIESTPTSGSTKAITSGGVYDALGTKVGYALKNNVNVAGNTKNVGKTSPETLFVNNGLIMGGSAAQAGLVTRGICGVTTPSETNGACEKECLYVNYDGGGDYTYKSSRQLVIQAGNVGTHYGDNLYQYAAVRGDVAKAWLDKKVDKTTTVNGQALSGNVTVSKGDLGLGNFIPDAKTGLYGLELSTNEVVDIALSDKVYDTTLFVEYCRSSSDADGHHPELLAISFRYDTSEANKWVSTPRMAVLYSFNAADNYFKPELKYTADGHILLNLSASRRHAGQVTIIASSANSSFISVSKLAMSSSVWTGATAVTDVRVNAIDDTVVHKEGDETITGVKTISTSDKVGFTLEDDTDAQLRARQTGSTTRYIQLDVESGTAGSNVAVYARNGNTNGSYLVSIDSSTVNPGGRGISCLGQSTDTVVRLGSKKLDFSGTLGTDSNTLYFV